MSANPDAGLFFDPLASPASAGTAGVTGGRIATAGPPATPPSVASASLSAVQAWGPDVQQQLRSRRRQESREAALREVCKDLERLSRKRASGAGELTKTS